MDAQPAAGSAADAVRLGQRIRTLRRERGMSQQALAEPELSASYLSRIESGERPAPPATVQLLASRLGVTPAFLSTGISEDLRAHFRLSLETASYALASGDAEGALEAEDALRAAAGELQDPEQMQAVDALLARAREQSGGHVQALAQWRELLAHAVCPTPLWCEAAVAVTRLSRLVGDVGRAIEVGERLLAQLESAGVRDSPEAVRLLLTVMSALLERGDVTHAALMGEDAQRRAEAASDVASLGRAYWNSSTVQMEQGNPAAAADLAGRAATCLVEAVQPREAALVQVLRAQFLTRLERQAEARDLLQEASATLAVVGTVTDVAYLHLEFARAALADGQHREVLEHVAQVEADEMAVPAVRAEADLLAGRAEIAAGQQDDGLRRLRHAASTLSSTTVTRHAGRAWVELADALDSVGDVAGARDAYRAATASLGLIPDSVRATAQSST